MVHALLAGLIAVVIVVQATRVSYHSFWLRASVEVVVTRKLPVPEASDTPSLSPSDWRLIPPPSIPASVIVPPW